MIKKDLNAIIHQLELKTRKFLSGPLSGDYRNKLKGSGFDFDQLRDYQQSDDIRYIDWKSSARANKMLVRQYLEDRNRAVLICVDFSASTLFGSSDNLKSEFIIELAAILTFVALDHKDAVGLLIFTDQVELFIAPRTGRKHVLNLVKTLLMYEAKSKKSNFDAVAQHIGTMKSKNMLVCVISDFEFKINSSLLRLILKKHELIAFRCLDEREISIPDVGLLNVQDIETSQSYTIDTSDNIVDSYLALFNREQKNILKSARVDCFDAIISKPYANELVKFLRQRVG